MMRHLLRLVWNRKRTNTLLIAEILVSFLVLFAVLATAAYYADNYRQPLGFEHDNVWSISIDMRMTGNDSWDEAMVEQFQQVYLALRDFPEVEGAAGIMFPLYGTMSSDDIYRRDGRQVPFERNELTDGIYDVMRLDLVEGRWFGPEHDGLTWKPVVINRAFALAVFGEADPLGRNIAPEKDFEGNPFSEEWRVVGIVSDFRRAGEFAAPRPAVLYRVTLGDSGARPPRTCLVRIRPGAAADTEERIVRRLQAVAPHWSFEAQPLSDLRGDSLQLSLLPLAALGIVGVFLMIMVGLGLVGVLWQNVTRRYSEIGLRRASGATAGEIYRQVLGELMVVTTFGVLLGMLLTLQIPLLNLVQAIEPRVVLAATLGAAAAIYLLTLLCGAYPSWIATRIHPSEALRYE